MTVEIRKNSMNHYQIICAQKKEYEKNLLKKLYEFDTALNKKDYIC